MPKIQTYDQPLVTPDRMPSGQQHVNHTSDAYGHGVGGAVRNLGNVLGRYAEQKAEEDGRQWAIENFSAMKIRAYQRELDFREKGPANGSGHTQGIAESYKADYEAVLKNAPNKYARQMFENYGAQAWDATINTASSFEFQQRQRYRMTSFQNNLELLKSHVVDNPDQFESSRAVIDEYVMTLPKAEHGGARLKAKAELAMSAVQGQIARDPEAAVRVLESAITFNASAFDKDALYGAIEGQESNGRIDAISHKGARGLMQLMPDTAKDMAVKLGLSYTPERLTTDPEYNRILGRAYFDQQLDAFEGSVVLALAAYNAGPNRVRKWLKTIGDPRKGELSEEEWLKQLPKGFDETRKYVPGVLGRIPGAVDKHDITDPVIAASWPDLTAEQKLWALNQAKSTAKQRQSEGRATLAQLVSDATTAHLNGRTPEVEPTEAQMIHAHGPEVGAIKWQEYQDTRDVGMVLKEYQTMPGTEVEAQWRAREPQPGEGYDHAYKLWEMEGKAVAGMMKARKDDPVGAVMTAFPGMREAFEKAKPEDMPQHYAALWDYQNQLDIADEQKALLTKGQASSLIERWNDVSQPLNTRVAALGAVMSSTSDPRQQTAILMQLDRAGLPKGVIHIAGPMQSDPRAVRTMLTGVDVRKLQPQYNPEKGEWNAGYASALPPDVLKAFSPAFQDGLEEAVRNYYVGLSYEAGKADGLLDRKLLTQAVEAVTGGVLDIDRVGVGWDDNYKTLAMWSGQTADEFEQIIASVTDEDIDGAWLADSSGKGGGKLSLSTFQRHATLRALGNGRYTAWVGENPVIGRDFEPVVMDFEAARKRFAEKKERLALPSGVGKLRMTREQAVEIKQYLE